MRKEKQKIGRAFLVLLYIIVVIGIVVVFNSYVNKQLQNQLRGVLSDVSKQTIITIQNTTSQKLKGLQELAQDISSDDDSSYQTVHKYLIGHADILGYRELAVALLDGTVYMDNGVYNISEREYFQRAKQGETYISKVLHDVRDGDEINAYSVPIYDSKGTINGVLVGIDSTETFMQMFQVPIFDGKGYLYLMDSNANVIIGSDNRDIGMANLLENLEQFPHNEKAIEKLSTALKNKESTTLYINNYGFKYNYIQPLNVNDWWLVAGVPSSVLESRVTDVTNTMKIVSAGIVLMSFGVLIWFLHIKQNSEDFFKEMAYIDPFTKINNKAYMQDHFSKTIKSTDNKKYALVIYNIRKFKLINEIYGVNIGDDLIKQVATILRRNKKLKDEIAIRDHSDEFSVLYCYKTREELEERIQKVIKDTEVINIRGNDIQVNLSIGVYEITDPKTSFEQAYSYAKMVNKQNKDTMEPYCFYTEELKQRQVEEKELNDSIKEGIAKGEFRAWLQPKYDTHTNRIVGAEALVRWHKSDGKVLSPYFFIDYCEKYGLIQEIDRLVLEDVCRQVSDWRRKGIPCVPVSVNLSRAYLNNANSIYYIQTVLDKYNVPSCYIQLEVTESAVVDSEEELSASIETMHDLGFKVLLDDFGVGYSSLTSINKLQFDILKIDKSFIDALGTHKGEDIVKYTISLAKSLGMKIVAEGVETKEQYEFLREEECDAVQGYYFSKPLSSEDFRSRIKESSGR